VGTLTAVFAHPDDETFICGGTLAKVAANGHRVVLVCATKGEMGRRLGNPPTATRETLAQLRENEMNSACTALGVTELVWLGLRDKTLEIQSADALAKMVQQQLDAAQPDVVVTFHPTRGGHPDHCAIGLATTSAFSDYGLQYPQARLYYVAWSSMLGGTGVDASAPAAYVQEDVQTHLAAKLQAFRAHRTQSQIHRWLWQRDQASMRKLAATEYFISAGGPKANTVLPTSSCVGC